MRILPIATLFVVLGAGSVQAQSTLQAQAGGCTMQDQSGCHTCTDWENLCINNCSSNARCMPDCKDRAQLCMSSGSWTDRFGHAHPGVSKQ